MIVVMQCAGLKMPDAGCMRTAEGRKVKFVAHPDRAPAADFLYAHPDDDAGMGETWRSKLLRYNEAPGENPLGLLRAFELYRNDVYRRLARHVGIENLFILSAGWGLIPASFLTPDYDITFTKTSDEYKRRTMSDSYRDFQMLPPDTKRPVVFIGSKEYVPLFVSLTSTLTAPRTLFYRTDTEPQAPGCKIVRYQSRGTTNWQYGCADHFINGKLEIRFEHPL